MSTSIRPEVSLHNKYHISKHRYYELKYFCLQYGEWKKLGREDNTKLIEDISQSTDECIGTYILKAVTENYTYTYLRNVMKIPCGRDAYYELYRKFFYLLNNARY